MTAQNVMSVPTDKSMPPVMMTKVQAMASTPLTAVACRMPTMLSVCRKLGDATLKKTINPTRLANASSFCRVLGLKRERLESLQCGAIRTCGGVGFMLSERRSGRQCTVALTMDSRWVASCMICSCVAPAAGSSPVIRPSHITRMRWLRRSTSGSSDEIITIALAPARPVRSAACRSRSWRRRRCRAWARRRTGFRNRAPAIWRSRSFAGCRPTAGRTFCDTEGVLIPSRLTKSRGRVADDRASEEKAQRQEAPHAGQDDVGLHVHARGQAEMLAVLRKVADAAARTASAGLRMRHLCASHPDLAGVHACRRRIRRAPLPSGPRPSARRNPGSRPCAPTKFTSLMVAPAVQIAHLQHDLVVRGAGAIRAITFKQGAPHHHADDGIHAGGRGRHRAMYRPSRITVTRSAILFSSSILCEM